MAIVMLNGSLIDGDPSKVVAAVALALLGSMLAAFTVLLLSGFLRR